MQVDNWKEGLGEKFIRKLKKREIARGRSTEERIQNMADTFQAVGRDLGAANVNVYKRAAGDYHLAKNRVNQLRDDMPFYDVGVPALKQVIEARGTKGYRAAVESAMDKFNENQGWQRAANRRDLMLRVQDLSADQPALTMGNVRALQNEGRTKRARLEATEARMDHASRALDLMGAQMDALEMPNRTGRAQDDAREVRAAYDEVKSDTGRHAAAVADNVDFVSLRGNPRESALVDYRPEFIEGGAREYNKPEREDEPEEEFYVPLDENVAGVPAVGGFTPYANAQLIPLVNRIG